MNSYLNILVLVPTIPFSRGGAEFLVESLLSEFRKLGHSADLFSVPFFPEPKEKLLEQMLIWRSFDVEKVAGRRIDLVIPTKFPTFYARHPRKVPWLLHQHRQAYELLNTRFGDFAPQDEDIREEILSNDKKMLSECRKIFTISDNVSARLKNFLELDSDVLLPPLPSSLIGTFSAKKGEYILSVGRLCSAKRPDLVVEAMSQIPSELGLKLVGVADEPGYMDYLQSIIKKHHLGSRVEILGGVTEGELAELYANCHSVYYGPYDEDYGYVIYEASASRKPIVTLEDSGFSKIQVEREQTGIVVAPDPLLVAEAFTRLRDDIGLYEHFQENCVKLQIPNTWSDICNSLISALG